MKFISCGHNQAKQGASYKDVTEFILADKWADLIVELLGEDAIRVPNGTLTEKVKFINGLQPNGNIAVEIHFNSYKKWKDLNGNGIVDAGEIIALGKGSETLYMPNSIKGKAAAEHMQSHLGRLMQPDRGAKEGWYQMNPDKGADYFLHATNCTALIIEPEFIDNLEEINHNMKTACEVIAAALMEL